ncbi:MAG: CCA tRNA nucleotidyltransferase, partial [Methanobacterium sp.]
LEAASKKWVPKIVIDLENYGTSQQFSEFMVVIDPTDKNRNVAAALTIQKLSEFIIASRNFLNDPKKDYFFKKEFNIDLDIIKDNFLQRGTKTLLITFKPPYVPADSLYSQIKKTENSLKDALEREDFKLLDTASYTDEKEKVIILLELEVWKLPSVKKHFGPPIWSQEHQNRFISKYGDKAYIEGDKWMVLIERKYNNVESFIEDNLSGNKIGLLRFGKHIKDKILKEHNLMDILDYLKLSKCNEDELLFFFEYLNKNIHLSR